MEESKDKKSLWPYLIPIYLLAAIPLVKWAMKPSTENTPLPKGAAQAFNSEEGELPAESNGDLPRPDFNEGILGVRYTAKGSKGRPVQELPARQTTPLTEEPVRQQKTVQVPPPTSAQAAKAQKVGATKGLLGYAIGKVANNPKALASLLNNKYVVAGFMARPAVKAATANPQALAAFLKDGSAITNFMNNPMVQNGLRNPDMINAAMTSGFASALLNTPAGQQLINNPQLIGDLFTSNPELMKAMLSNPNLVSTIMSNPNAAQVANRTGLTSR